MIHEGLTARKADRAQGISPRTAYKGVRRYREERVAGLLDRSSRPRRTPGTLRERIKALCRQRWPYQPSPIRLGFPRARWPGSSRPRAFTADRSWNPSPRPGAMRSRHPDSKKLAQFQRLGHPVPGDRRRSSPGAGYEAIYAAVDAQSRLAYCGGERGRAEGECGGFSARGIATLPAPGRSGSNGNGR